MIQMLSKLLIPVAPRRDMKIPLHLIPFQTPINPTRLPLPAHPRRLAKLPPPLPLRQHIVHVLFLLHLQGPAAMQSMHVLGIHPLLPVRRIPPQHVACEDPIARCVLHVDVQVRAPHGDHDV